MVSGVAHRFLAIFIGCAVLVAGGKAPTAKAARGSRDHVMLQAGLTKSKTDGAPVVKKAPPTPEQKEENCRAFAEGTDQACDAVPSASLETKGASRMQTKTKMSKVVLDLEEDED
mmetsp:Transcript_71878/g.163169  ORF Transcript_71878/g.163169 Transcript_71878/m.163169 type:complete len:115 (+) Transcript_71878:103-447(+)